MLGRRNLFNQQIV